jgi:hypothetical protein
MAVEGTRSAEAAVEGVKLEGRTVRRTVEGVREGRRGTRVVNVLERLVDSSVNEGDVRVYLGD